MKNGSHPVPEFSSTILADSVPDLIYRQNSLDYQGTHAVTGKRRFVQEFLAKYMLQIGYLTYCTTDIK